MQQWGLPELSSCFINLKMSVVPCFLGLIKPLAAKIRV